MSKKLFTAAAVIALIGGAYVFYAGNSTHSSAVAPALTPVDTSLVAPVESTATTPIAHPQAIVEPAPNPAVMETETAAIDPLPELDRSDMSLFEKVQQLATLPKGLQLNKDFARKLVLAVDSLSRGEISYKYPPFNAPLSRFSESVNEVKPATDPRQYRMGEATHLRYSAYIDAFTEIDPKALAALYRWSYPLLNQAWEELGNPGPGFHPVAVKAIDRILAAPEIDGEIILTQPSVFYRYANPQLEKLSDSDKLMLRIGAEQSRRFKQSLRELRKQIVTPA